MPISITKGINFNSSGSAIINNEIIFNQPSVFNQTTTFNSFGTFNQGTTFNSSGTFNQGITFNQEAIFNSSGTFNQEAIFNKNISTVSGTSNTIFNVQGKLLIPTASGTENRLIWIS